MYFKKNSIFIHFTSEYICSIYWVIYFSWNTRHLLGYLWNTDQDVQTGIQDRATDTGHMWPSSNIYPSHWFFLCTMSHLSVCLKQMCNHYCRIHTFVYLLECFLQLFQRQGWSFWDHCLGVISTTLSWDKLQAKEFHLSLFFLSCD